MEVGIFDTSFFYVFIILIASSLAAISQSQLKLTYLKEVILRKTSFSFSRFLSLKEDNSVSKSKDRKSKKEKNYNPYFFWAAFLVMALPVALRFYTGADYQTYEYWFLRISKEGLETAKVIEPGYALLCIVCSKLFENVQSMFFMIAFITNFFIFKAISYEARRISLGAAVFAYGFIIYLWGFIIIRNLLAVSIVFFALRYLFENKLVRYFLFVGLACLFHYSALIFFFVGPMYIEKLKKFRIAYLIGLFGILPVFPKVISWLSDYIVKFIPKFGFYIKGFKKIEARFDFDAMVWVALCTFVLLFFIYYLKRRKIDEHISLYFSFYLITIFLGFFVSSQLILERYMIYFSIGQIVLIGGVVRSFERKKLFKIVIISLLLLYGIGEIRNFAIEPWYRMLPYQSVFDKEKATKYFEGNYINK